MDEFELKFLDIDVAAIELRLKDLGGECKGEEFLEEWLYWRPEWKEYRGRVRLRDSGRECRIAYKETSGKTGDGNLELEFTVSNGAVAKQFLDKVIGDTSIRHQQKKRRKYFLADYNVEVDIDFWPMLPAYIEIEGNDRVSIEKVATALGFNLKDAVEKDALQIYEEVYKISLNEVKELVF